MNSRTTRGKQPENWTLWLDVGNIHTDFLFARTPTGIQRVGVSLKAAWSDPDRGYGPLVRLCRFDPQALRFAEVPDKLFTEIAGGCANLRQSVEKIGKSLPIKDKMKRRFKLAYYGALHRTFGNREHKLDKWRYRPVAWHLEQILIGLPDAPISAADVVLFFGVPMSSEQYFGQLRSVKRMFGFRVAWIVHDLIPYLRPEFFPPETYKHFCRFASELLGSADLALCVSRTTLRDLIQFASINGASLPDTAVIRLGSDGPGQTLPVNRRPVGTNTPMRPYVLMTGTIEPRKNHMAVIGAWWRLIECHGSDSVPDLVLAGRRGWLVDQVFEFLMSTRYLNGKVVHQVEVTDIELSELYRDCLFTIYPSLYEGYGLPVAESLQFGKLCIASNASSIMEIGGELVDYVDPRDAKGLYFAVERAVFDHDYRRAREDEIGRKHRPYLWNDSATDVMKIIANYRRNAIKHRTRSDGTTKWSSP